MDENLERGIKENERIVDLDQSATRRDGKKSTSAEDVQGSECNPFFGSPSQRRSPDGFPRLSGSGRKHGPNSDHASDFWSQGVAIWRALDTRSNGNQTSSDSTALIKGPENHPADRDPAESTPTNSRDQLHRSRILSFLESDETSAPSSGADHLALIVPASSFTIFDEAPDYETMPLCPSPENPTEVLAPDVEARDEPSGHQRELDAQKRRSSISVGVSKSPAKPHDKANNSPMDAGIVSLHAGRERSTITSHLESEDNPQGLRFTGRPKPVIPTAARFSSNANSHRALGSRPFLPKQQRNTYASQKPYGVPKHNRASNAEATSHLFEPRSVTPTTPTRKPRISHPKSFSVECPAFYPRLPSSSPSTPARSYSGGHVRSVSMGTGHSHPSSMSVMLNTPLGQLNLRPFGQFSMGTPPPFLIDPRVFEASGGSIRPFIHPHYPEPHQHTPEEQGQRFDTQGPMPPQMSYQSCNFIGPNVLSFPSPMHPSDNSTIHYNAQFCKQGEQNTEYSQPNHFDSYSSSQTANATPNNADIHQNGNIYTQDTNGYGPRYYSNHTDLSHQLNQNLYTPLEPYREPTKPNQRTAKDLFIPEDLRLKLHTRTEATLRVFAVSNTPTLEHYHTLTPLAGVNQQQSQALRGYSNTVYKAVSAKDGKTYCLRRIHEYRATNLNENAIFAVRQKWAAVRNSNVVSLHFAFTTTILDDSSLVVVSDYHPDSKTVAEKHFSQTPGRSNRNVPPLVSEHILWSYIVQIANALKAVHSAQLAARVIEPTKVIVTDENRIRLNGCALEDLLDNEAHDITDLQRLDFHKFGSFIVAVGTNNMSNSSSRARAPDVFAQNYSKNNSQLKSVVEWLLDHDKPENNEEIDVLIKMISSNAIDSFDASLRFNDQLYFSLNKEIENSRIVRLMTKLNCVNERPEYEHDRTYSSQGTRAVLGLFRDYIFHQVDAQANPVVDMGHILSCLNKLDAGIEERIALTARDEQSVIVVSYKELKGAVESTWQELMRRSSG